MARLRILMKRRRPSMGPAWRTLLGCTMGLACSLPQVGLPAATKIASDAGWTSDVGGKSDSGRKSDPGRNSDVGVDSDNSCQTLEFNLDRPEGDVILVVDRSTAAGSSNQDKCPECTTYWNSLREAIDVLTGNQGDQFRFGLKLFPSVGAGSSCQVNAALDVPVSGSGGQEIKSLLESTSPGGQAPAKLGLRSAISALGVSHSSLPPKMIVLALAGLPTCGGADITQDDTSNVMSEIGQATAVGIPVFVLGPGRIQATLDRMASAGNTETAYSPYMPWDLQLDMQISAWSNAPCTYALPKGIGSSPAISLYFKDMGQKGRRPVSGFSVAPDGSSVTLYDETCADMRGYTVDSVIIEVNCPG